MPNLNPFGRSTLGAFIASPLGARLPVAPAGCGCGAAKPTAIRVVLSGLSVPTTCCAYLTRSSRRVETALALNGTYTLPLFHPDNPCYYMYDTGLTFTIRRWTVDPDCPVGSGSPLTLPLIWSLELRADPVIPTFLRLASTAAGTGGYVFFKAGFNLANCIDPVGPIANQIAFCTSGLWGELNQGSGGSVTVEFLY